MLAINIDDKMIEKSLKTEFKSAEEIKEYLYKLILEDLEDKRIFNLMKDSHKKEFVSKKEVFDILDTI